MLRYDGPLSLALLTERKQGVSLCHFQLCLQLEPSAPSRDVGDRDFYRLLLTDQDHDLLSRVARQRLPNTGTVLRLCHHPVVPQGSVEGGLADFHASGGLAHGEAGGNKLAGTDDLLRRCGNRPSALSSSRRRSCEPCIRPFADQVAFELTKGPEDVEHQPSGRGGGVDILRQRPESDAAALKIGDGVQ